MDGPESQLTQLAGWTGILLGMIALVPSLRFLSRRNPEDVRTVWYFFALAYVISLLLAWWAISVGAFEGTRLVGPFGLKLSQLLDEVEDFSLDILILLVVVTILIVPQVLGYLLSAMTGCASDVWLFAAAVPFFMWGLIKFFAIAAGVSLGLAFTHGYLVDALRGSATDDVGSTMMNLAAAFLVLVAYRSMQGLAKRMFERCPSFVRDAARRVHNWAKRSRTSLRPTKGD